MSKFTPFNRISRFTPMNWSGPDSQESRNKAEEEERIARLAKHLATLRDAIAYFDDRADQWKDEDGQVFHNEEMRLQDGLMRLRDDELHARTAEMEAHAAELEAARVKVFALAKDAAQFDHDSGGDNDGDECTAECIGCRVLQAIADYDALAARGK